MVSPAVGKVILVPFPFSDSSQSKLRPAVVLADAGRGDWVPCQVTGNPVPYPEGALAAIGAVADGGQREPFTLPPVFASSPQILSI